MQRLVILHTNDVHGRVDGLARVATMVAHFRKTEPDAQVFYLDIGDSEESSVRVSNVTKGAAMHRLLSAAGCDAAAVGNAAPGRYGPQVLVEHAASASYPLLLANLRTPDGAPVPGVQPSVLLSLGTLRLGLVGITSEMWGLYERDFGLRVPRADEVVREIAASLRQDGADAVILLSHMGLEIDRKLAAALPELSLILGAHSHNLLPEGERVGRVVIAQAGSHAEHLGRVDLLWSGEHLSVESVRTLTVDRDLTPLPAVLAVVEEVETEIESYLSEVIGELSGPLEYAADRECSGGNFVADVLRERMNAEVGVVAVGQALAGPLPAGPLRRGALWDVCHSTANPGVVSLTGARLAALVARGLDPAYAAQTAGPLRGNSRGLMHLSGASVRNGTLLVDDQPVDPEREYVVAGTDWELAPYGGYAEESWGLRVQYDMPTILREAIEHYLSTHALVDVDTGRLGQ